MKNRKKALPLALALFLTGAAAAAGCSGPLFPGTESGTAPETAGEENPGPASETKRQEPETEEKPGPASETKQPDPGSEKPEPESEGKGPEPGEEWRGPAGESEPEADGPEDEEDERFVMKTIVLATDLHYLAEDLSGNRCQTFVSAAQHSDGRVLQYTWEIMDAFVDDVLELHPDLVVLAGDLTLDGEKASHLELASILETFLENDIEVAVIPGNHDINNAAARRYKADGTEWVDSVDAEEFRRICADFGYVAADSRDPSSLSYLYRLNDYYWLLMLDTCQYETVNLPGGMVRGGTYEWMEKILDAAWEEGAQVITVSHHNLFDQSGVSPAFYDDCTIEHSEELAELLSDYEVRLHLSGHLHIQHYLQDEESGISEVVTGSLLMAPCNYGVIQIWNDGTYQYDAHSVDVDGWAERNSYRNRSLAEFSRYSRDFLYQLAYGNAVWDLERHMRERGIYLTAEQEDAMARFYAELCVRYYGGTMFEIADRAASDPAAAAWEELSYASDLSDFLLNILEDEAKDFAHLTLPY